MFTSMGNTSRVILSIVLGVVLHAVIIGPILVMMLDTMACWLCGHVECVLDPSKVKASPCMLNGIIILRLICEIYQRMGDRCRSGGWYCVVRWIFRTCCQIEGFAWLEHASTGVTVLSGVEL